MQHTRRAVRLATLAAAVILLVAVSLSLSSAAPRERDDLQPQLPLSRTPATHTKVKISITRGADHESPQQHSSSSKCACTGGKKACLFVHGLGRSGTEGVFASYAAYWGRIKSQAACCSSSSFLRMDTVNNAWHADVLSKQLCAAALALAPNSSSPMQLENVALVGHSMGSLVIAAAAMRGLCAVGPSSKWISLAAPLGGSMAATTALAKCAANSSDKAMRAVLSQLDLCPVGESARSLTYVNSSATPEALRALYANASAAFRQYATSALCGVSPVGLASPVSAWYAMVSEALGHRSSLNDGAVEFDSCRGGLAPERFGGSWRRDHFYRARLNHADSRFLFGDGLAGDDRKPVAWFNCQF